MHRSEKFGNLEIVTIAVSRLGGDIKPIHIEDIAIEAFKIAPKRFCWRKYPERIDLALVRDALANASKVRHKQLLRGSHKKGWMLTTGGLRWLQSLNIETLDGEFVETSVRKGSVVAALDVERERLRQSNAYIKFQSRHFKSIVASDFQEFLRINEYFPLRKRFERFQVVENAVAGDKQLSSVWRHLKAKFEKEFINANQESN